MNDELFHDDCGGMLKPETVESEETGEELTLRYCGSCDAYVESDIGDEWTVRIDQEESEDLDNMIEAELDMAVTKYEFKDCDHNKGILHEQAASRGDEDNLIMYECIECGNRERETYTRF